MTGAPGRAITVMTRNVYLGADLNRPLHAARDAQQGGGTPAEVLLALAHATHLTRGIVDRTDFTVRAQLLADEVLRTRPDIVGLQEVAWWRRGPLRLDRAGVPDARTTDYDFLQLLLDALAARGRSYTAAAVGPRADVEGPGFTGSPFDGTLGVDACDVRLTLRDVVLVRAGDGLTVMASGDHVFETNLEVSVLGRTMRFDRGYQWVDVRAGARRLRFINTHLEAFSSDVAHAQAAELLAEAPAADRIDVLVCDANSDPLESSVRSSVGDSRPHSAAYDLITGPGGFTDEWLRWAPAEEGWTSGLSETVDDPTPAGFRRRIDMVFARTSSGGGLAVEKGEVTGTDLADRDPATGLWPSDHGGVVLRLRLP